MKLKNLELDLFRRFHNLKIENLPPARLVVMAGPNGSGKSSVFDAFSHYVGRHFGMGWDQEYFDRIRDAGPWGKRISISFHSGDPTNPKKAFYVRSAYRNDPEFQLSKLNRVDDPIESRRVMRMIDQDANVSSNFQRLVSNAIEDAFENSPGKTSLDEFRVQTIGDLRASILRLFPDLDLNTLGNPLVDGTFRFTKGTSKGFSYKNLSGGEKATFDLILDIVVKRKAFDDTVFAIDEPEAHIGTRLQGALLQELFDLTPANSQLWVATHSIGMMRRARALHAANPGQVVFLDFEGHDYDKPVAMSPVIPNRNFWERTLRVALDDLADLVVPKTVVICEGNPKAKVAAKNDEHDARCYNIIFDSEFPDAKFVSGGGSKDVQKDRLGFAAAFGNLATGISVVRVIDRDDHAAGDIAEFKKEGIQVLGRRHIESYLYDLDVLRKLYANHNAESKIPDLEKTYAVELEKSVKERTNPVDDIKSIAPVVYVYIKKDLLLTACGDDALAFARNILAPLVKPGMNVYAELRKAIFDR